jgi:transcriptional regulator with XRE-family HTH domain
MEDVDQLEGDGVFRLDEAARSADPVAALGPQIRELRKTRRLTLTDLARRTGLSIGHLSQVERGLSTPTIRQLQQISAAMDVQIGWFFRTDPPAEDAESAVVVRAARRQTLRIGELGITDELLVPNLEGQLEMMMCTIQPGMGSGDEPYSHDGEEAGFLLAGELDLWVDDRRYHLKAGDSFAFASTRPHRYRNPGPTAAQVIWVITPPTY